MPDFRDCKTDKNHSRMFHLNKAMWMVFNFKCLGFHYDTTPVYRRRRSKPTFAKQHAERATDNFQLFNNILLTHSVPENRRNCSIACSKATSQKRSKNYSMEKSPHLWVKKMSAGSVWLAVSKTLPQGFLFDKPQAHHFEIPAAIDATCQVKNWIQIVYLRPSKKQQRQKQTNKKCFSSSPALFLVHPHLPHATKT